MTLALIFGTGAAPSWADHTTYYGDSSRAVAAHLGCKRFYYPRGSGEGEYNLDSGVCWLKRKRVNIITFRGPVQQREWNAAARFAFSSDFFWGNGQGALVVARNGNRPAAKVGARLLPGRVVHGI